MKVNYVNQDNIFTELWEGARGQERGRELWGSLTSNRWSINRQVSIEINRWTFWEPKKCVTCLRLVAKWKQTDLPVISMYVHEKIQLFCCSISDRWWRLFSKSAFWLICDLGRIPIELIIIESIFKPLIAAAFWILIGGKSIKPWTEKRLSYIYYII